MQHNLHEAVVNLTQSTVESNVKLGPFIHANGDGEEIVAVEKALLAHPDVQAEIAKLKLPEGTEIVSDPWIYGKLATEPIPADTKRDTKWEIFLLTLRSQAPTASWTASFTMTSA